MVAAVVVEEATRHLKRDCQAIECNPTEVAGAFLQPCEGLAANSSAFPGALLQSLIPAQENR